MQSNSGPAGSIFLLLLIVLSIIAIAGAKGLKWKFINLGIIIGFMAFGMLIGLLIGGNSAMGGHIAASLMLPIGAVGAGGCIRRNKARAKKEMALP